MKIDRALKIRNETKALLADTFNSAFYWRPTSEKLEKQRIVVLGKISSKTPYWVLAYLDGFWSAKIDSLYKSTLVFGGFVDGVFYSTNRARPDYYEKHGISSADYADNGRVSGRGHYWPEMPGGRDGVKPWFIHATRADFIEYQESGQ